MFNMTNAELVRTGALLGVMLLAMWHSHRTGYVSGVRNGFVVGVNGTVAFLHKDAMLSARNEDEDRDATVDELKAHILAVVHAEVIKNGADDEVRL